MRTFLFITLILLFGCTGEIRSTTTARTATEMLLLTTAADRATRSYEIELQLQGKKVFFEDSFFDSIDKSYIVSNMRDHLSKNLVILVDKKEDSEYVVELRNGSLGLYDSNFNVGMPELPLILGFGGQEVPPFVTPEVSLFKRKTQQGWCKLKLWVFETKTGKYVSHPPTLWGNSYCDHITIFGIGPININDIYPE